MAAEAAPPAGVLSVTPGGYCGGCANPALAFASGRQPRTRDRAEWCWRVELLWWCKASFLLMV